MAWQTQSPPGEWAEAASRWSFAHDLRTLFSVLGFGLLLAGALRPIGEEAA